MVLSLTKEEIECRTFLYRSTTTVLWPPEEIAQLSFRPSPVDTSRPQLTTCQLRTTAIGGLRTIRRYGTVSLTSCTNIVEMATFTF